jgi:hypothetical protein
VKIFVAAVEALRKKERGYETQFTTKIGVIYFLNQFFDFAKVLILLKKHITEEFFNMVFPRSYSFPKKKLTK